MLSKDAAHAALAKVFRRRRVVDRDALFKVLGTRSRMTVFRRLRELDHMTSYTHAGRYYTLRDIPELDDHGLWVYRSIGFSRFGTLKATTRALVEASSAGYTHPELEGLLRTRVHNTLLDLVEAREIRREGVAKRYLYVSADPTCAEEQRARRQQVRPSARTLPTEMMVAVLVEALRAGKVLAPASVVATRLAARDLVVTAGEVQQVYNHHGLSPEKKTPASRSRRSRR